MVTVFVSHPPDKLATYFGAKATQRLCAIAEVRFNEAPGDLTLTTLIKAARGCDALIAYRQTGSDAGTRARAPRVIATPHVAGLTLPAIEHQALETVDPLATLLKGEMPIGAVNPTHADRWQRWRDSQRARGTLP